MKTTIPPVRRRGLGLSLIETAMALAVSALAMGAMIAMMQDGTEAIRSKATADRMGQVVAAAKNYVRVYNAQLVSGAHGAAAPIQVVTPAAGPTIGGTPLPGLRNGGFLPSNFVDTNPYGQQTAVLIRETQQNVLEVMITTYGGRPIPDKEIGRIATRVGAEGGFMMTTPTGTVPANNVQGVYGGWRVPAATWASGATTPAAGRIMAALGFDSGTVLNDYLYRYDIGVPEANRMNTTMTFADPAAMPAGPTGTGPTGINMRGNDIVDADDITARDTISACGVGATTGDATGCGVIVSNDGGFYDRNNGWITYEGVAGGTGLRIGGAGNNLEVGGNELVRGSSEVDGILYADNGVHVRADWVRVYGDNGIYWQNWGGGWYMTDTTWVRVYNDRNVRTGGTIEAGTEMRAPRFVDLNNGAFALDPNGASTINDLTANNVTASYVRPTQLFGDTTIRDSSRTSINNVRLADLIPNYVHKATYVANNGTGIPAPSCGPAGQPKIILTLHKAAWGACTDPMYCGNGGGGLAMYAVWNGSGWGVFFDLVNNQVQPVALAQTFCYYPS